MYQPPTNDPQSQRPPEPSQFPYQQPPLQPSPYPPPQYPQQPYYPPGTPPPQPKKRRTGLWIALGIVALLLFACIGFGTLALRGASTAVNSVATSVSSTLTPSSGSTPTTAATQGAPGTWKTIKTFTGNGTKKTEVFAVPGTWRIVWTCGKDTQLNVSNALAVTVYGSDGSIIDVAVNATCDQTVNTDNTIEHQGGQVYLDINGTGKWKVEVQTQ